ncbi:MAG: L,D-transpeptidase family protein [Roseitalea porphyridii]|uniref:L,D-transpeptidase family protein n=2 Tax=Roseitalea porphyridii TaxID=1852022 RepID=UPI0032EEA29D
MVHQSIGRMLLGAAVIATGWAAAPHPAGASEVQLHELLFNRAKRDKRRQEIRGTAPREQSRPRQSSRSNAAPARPVARISGPSYYTYAAPAVSTITLVSLLPDVTTTGAIGEEGADGLPPLMVLENDRFREALAYAPQDGLAIEPGIADAVRAHYAENPAFLWVEGMNVNAAGEAVAALVNDAAAHGLQADHYAVDLPPSGWSPDDPAARYRELLAFELTLTAHALRYAQDMKDGAVNPNKLSGYHDFTKDRLSAADAMTALADADAPAKWLESLTPRQPDYARLQQELEVLRASTEDAIVIEQGTFIRPGDTSDALPMVIKAAREKMSEDTRETHADTLAAYADETLYDDTLVALIKDVQADLNLVSDGIVGPKTVSRLDGQSLSSRIERVELALERLRWHPEEYGARQVVINQPEYRVRYMEGGETTLSMRAIVGKKSNQTYFFHDEIEHVVYDPYWGVPQSIIVNEMLPKLRRDPSYLDRNGYVVTTASGRQVSSSAINWYQFGSSVPYNVRQKPGPRNALGELKIMFPNSHAIYMHDTPARNLFSRDNRAYSHGCVRLEDPRGMAAAVLGTSVDHVSSQLGGYEQVEKLAETVPVYVAYFTAWPNDEGVVDYHPDVYDRDSYLRRALDTVAKARSG